MGDVIAWKKIDDVAASVETKLTNHATELNDSMDDLIVAVQDELNAATTAQAQTLNTIKALVERGAVKSVQRGTTGRTGTGTTNTSTLFTTNVTISAVDTAKCLVLASPSTDKVNASYPNVGAELTSSTNLQIKGYGTVTVNWQIIEFY